MSSKACAYGSKDGPCGEPTDGADTLCPWHRGIIDDEKRRLGVGAKAGLTLDIDATGARVVVQFLGPKKAS
ncbi:MAG: hypothetical protein ABI134_35220 [Byssovorax sp.]